MSASPDILTTTLPDGTVGVAYSQEINVSGGTGDITMSLDSGTLPPGVAIQQAGISGGPKVDGVPFDLDEYTFTLKATDEDLNTDTQEYTVTIGESGEFKFAAKPSSTFGATRYELFQMCLGLEPEESIRHAIYESDQGDDGFGTSVLYGAETGLRSFKLKFPILAGFTTAANITVAGVTMTPAMYVWQLYRKCRRTGQPFVIQSPINDQYYLVKFAEPDMSMARMVTKLYSTGVALRQVRIEDVSIFDQRKLPGLAGFYLRGGYDLAGSDGVVSDRSGNNHRLTIHGNIANTGTTKNGWPSTRFNGGGTNTGYLNTTWDPTIYEAMFVMKVNEAAFSNYGGILSGSDVDVLTGNISTTKFYDHGLGEAYEYRKNGLLYANDNQQAPMNVFGLVHVRWQNGVALQNLQIGKNRTETTHYAEMDVLEVNLFTTLNPFDEMLELAESLMEIYDI